MVGQVFQNVFLVSKEESAISISPEYLESNRGMIFSNVESQVEGAKKGGEM